MTITQELHQITENWLRRQHPIQQRPQRQQVASGKALGITTIGIGIGTDVTSIYGQAVTVRNIADLGSASFKQIKLAA